MKRAFLLTGHFAQQKRRASLHWVSYHLQQSGWHVTHVTVGYSWLSRVLGDARLRALEHRPKTGLVHHGPTLSALFEFAPVHPVNLRHPALSRLGQKAWPLFFRYWERMLRDRLGEADLVICESGPSLLLAPLLARHASQAKRIYRVNDDIRLLNAPQGLIDAEQEMLHRFTRISTASPVLAKRFVGHPNVTLDPMGIPRHLVDQPHHDPYKRRAGQKIAVCAGTTQFDDAAILHLAKARPNWDIHILGRLRATPPQQQNVTWHGEQNFERTLAHIAHADIGLAPYRDAPGLEYQITNSNRMLLYRHFGLPILGPDRLCTPECPSIIGYRAPNALGLCEDFPHRPEVIPDWSELAHQLAQNGVTDPPSEVSTDPATMPTSRVKTVPALASTA